MTTHQLALLNTDRNIAANYTPFGIKPTSDEMEQIYRICLSIAEKERDGAYGQSAEGIYQTGSIGTEEKGFEGTMRPA